MVNSDQRLYNVKLKLSPSLEIWSLQKAMSGGHCSFIYLLRKSSFKIKKIVTIVAKSPWETIVILRIICVLLLNYKKENRCLPFISELLFPLPTQYDVENQKKLQVAVFNTDCIGGGVEVRQMKLHSRLPGVCAKVLKEHISPRTFVYDCSFGRLYSENRLSKLRKSFKLINLVKMDTSEFLRYVCLSLHSAFLLSIITFIWQVLDYVFLDCTLLGYSVASSKHELTVVRVNREDVTLPQ